MTAREQFEEILWLRHGWNNPRLDGNTKELVEHLADNPEIYCPFVDEMLRAPDDPLDLADYDVREPLGRALGMAELLGPEHCGNTVNRYFDEVMRSYKLLAPAPAAQQDDAARLKARARHECGFMLTSVLKVLRRFDDPHALRACMAMIESFEPAKGDAGKMYVMLEYMAKVAPQRPGCRTELDRMYHDCESRLYHQPRLKKVIDAIGAEASLPESEQSRP